MPDNYNTDNEFYNTDSHPGLYNTQTPAENDDYNNQLDQVAQVLNAPVQSFPEQAQAVLQVPLQGAEALDDPLLSGLRDLGGDEPSDAQLVRSLHAQNVQSVHQAIAPRGAPQGQRGLAEDAYRLEQADSKHRMGDLLAKLFGVYQTKPTTTPFFEWLNQLTYFEVVKLLKELGMSDSWIRQFAKTFVTGVQYMDAATRRQCAVNVQRTRLFTRGVVLDTERMQTQTVFSGKGWAIWVISPRDLIYSSSHVKGSLQHSSFLAGGNVKGAGEWKVVDGKIEYITGKSGHYQCDLDDLAACIAVLEKKNVDLSATKVIVWENGSPKTLTVPEFRAAASDPTLRAIGRQGMFDKQVDAPRSFIGSHRASRD